MDSVDAFNERLDRALVALGLTNAEFAAAFENGQQLVSGWRKRGRIGGPTAARLRRGELVPGFPIDWVNDEAGEPPAPVQRIQEVRPPYAFTSHSQRPSPEILRATQEFLDRAYEANGKEFSMYRDADLFADAYVWMLEDDRPVDERNLVDFLQWRVERERRGADEPKDRRSVGKATGANRSSAAQ